jgi:hypothetical protein
MKKTIALFGSLLIFAATKSKAQTPPQVPVKKETTKPASGTAPKTDAVDTFLKLGDLKGENKTSGATSVNPAFVKGANPAFVKGANPTFVKGAISSPNQSVAPRHNPPPANQSVAPRHKG